MCRVVDEFSKTSKAFQVSNKNTYQQIGSLLIINESSNPNFGVFNEISQSTCPLGSQIVDRILLITASDEVIQWRVKELQFVPTCSSSSESAFSVLSGNTQPPLPHFFCIACKERFPSVFEFFKHLSRQHPNAINSGTQKFPYKNDSQTLILMNNLKLYRGEPIWWVHCFLVFLRYLMTFGKIQPLNRLR
ncbi:hypothetical protein AB6A40_000513 [Gnathostoma spinigerum]|uniref:C2H2-type domain-containing protein n=1 Tax=Gnathostoma spinigerum TaxID=75299 RepID=A0ABD6E8W3_9BILA